MAETYTDATGKVFPLNAYGRPQGYWDGNKFVFPKFGNQPAAVQPVVEPVQPVVQPTNPYRLPSSVQQQQAQDSAGGQPPGAGAPAQLTGDPDGSLTLGRTYGLSGAALPVPGASLFGAAIGNAQSAANANALAQRSFGINPGLGIGSSLLNDATPFGLLGTSLSDQISALGYEMGSTPDGGMFTFEDSRPSFNQQMEDYYGINIPGVDPFGYGEDVGGGMKAFFTDDIGDIDPASNDPFGDIADALGLGEDTTGGDTTADDGVGFEP